jgi:5-methylcytosine-specific restriction enzyme subunit McrC
MTSSPFPIVSVAEWETIERTDIRLTSADWNVAEAMSTGDGRRLDIEERRGRVRIHARSWVGVVRFEQFELRIVPKLAGGNTGLVEMIELAEGLSALRRTKAARDLDATGAHLFDLIALLFAEASELVIRQGILADYVEREEDLPAVRGRLLADRQLLRRYGRVDRVECRFDEHDRDIPENKLLAMALEACARRVENTGVRRRVRQAHGIFADACSTHDADPTVLLEGMVYHRMNEHYRDAHELARIVLDGLGLDDVLRGGATRSFAFMIDMNRLFERFVRRLVERLLREHPCRVHYQKANKSILWDIGSDRPYTRVVPDLVVERLGEARSYLPIDAKYKLYSDRKVATADIYQAFLYAFAHGEGPLPRRALLLHPASTDRLESALRLQVRDAQQLGAAELGVLSLPIPRILEELRRQSLGPASARLVEALTDFAQ